MDDGRLKCPFCKSTLSEQAELHVLACSLAEISKQGSQTALAWRCEKAYQAYRKPSVALLTTVQIGRG